MKRYSASMVLPAALLVCGCAGGSAPVAVHPGRAFQDVNTVPHGYVPTAMRIDGNAGDDPTFPPPGVEPWAEEGRPRPVAPVMDDEGARLGQMLSHLDGAEFERVYLEHARHIQQAQRTARQRDQMTDSPLYIRR